jgi:hypothetical protein
MLLVVSLAVLVLCSLVAASVWWRRALATKLASMTMSTFHRALEAIAPEPDTQLPRPAVHGRSRLRPDDHFEQD